MYSWSTSIERKGFSSGFFGVLQVENGLQSCVVSLSVEISVLIKSQNRKNSHRQCIYLYRRLKSSIKREGNCPQAMSSCWLSLYAAWPGCPMQCWHAEVRLQGTGQGLQQCSRRIWQPHTELLRRGGAWSCACVQLCFLFLSRFLTSFLWLFTGYFWQMALRRVYLYHPCH